MKQHIQNMYDNDQEKKISTMYTFTLYRFKKTTTILLTAWRVVQLHTIYMQVLYVRYININSAKKVLDTYKSSIFTKMLHIRQIKSLLCESGECPLHFDTKLEGIGW